MNLRPTDYESATGRVCDLRRLPQTGPDLAVSMIPTSRDITATRGVSRILCGLPRTLSGTDRRAPRSASPPHGSTPAGRAEGNHWRSRRRPPRAWPRPTRSDRRLGGRTNVRQPQAASSSPFSGRPSVRLRYPQLGWFGAREPRSCCDEPTDDETGWDRDRNPDTQESRQSPCHIASLFRSA